LPFHLSFIQFLADHRTPLLTHLMRAATFFGSADAYILIILLLYVLWDKRLAIRLSVLVLLTMSVNDILKMFIRNPRPFVLQGTYQQKWAVSPAQANALAAEYSTPSGHAMGSSAFYTYLRAGLRSRMLRAALVILILLIGFSRPYLGVHYVEDILLGWLCGLSLAALAVRFAESLTSFWRSFSHTQQIALAVAGGLALILIFQLINGWQLDEAPRALIGYAGFLAGIAIACPLEARTVRFDPRSSGPAAKLLRLALSAALIFAVLLASEAIFPLIGGRLSLAGFCVQYLRYVAVGVTVVYLAPLLFTRLRLAGTLPAETS
jgi:membrane-associated phospholipid phosphatase